MTLGGSAPGRHRSKGAVVMSTLIVSRVVRAEVCASFGPLALPARVIALPPSVIAGKTMTLDGSHLRAVGSRARVGEPA